MAAIEAATLKEIASKKRPEGCTLLADHLGYERPLQDEPSQQSLIVDYLYDVIMHLVNKGLPWEQVCAAYTVAYEMISVTKDNPVTDAIKLFKMNCEAKLDKISLQNFKVFTDYFFSTYFTQYKLYQFVFNKDQESCTVKVNLDVETMAELQPFADAKEISIWEYEKKLETIDKVNESRIAEREQESLTARKQCDDEINKALDSIEDNQSLSDKEKLLDVIKSVTSVYIGAASQTLVQNVVNTMEDLEYQLERTAVPRPSELGAPQRLKTKPTLTAPKQPKSATRVKSGKSRGASAKKGRK